MRRTTWWRGALEALLAWIIAVAIRSLRATWRVRFHGYLPGGRAVLGFWHGDQAALAGVLAGAELAALVSQSRDGSIAARAAARLGFGVERGSSHRGAVTGARGLVRRLRDGGCVALAVDGPRGPRLRSGSSAMRLARMGRARVVPAAVAARRGYRASSWDRFLIPAPFTRVDVVLGLVLDGEPLQEAMDRVTREAVRWNNLCDGPGYG
jgi:hypothetical protein